MLYVAFADVAKKFYFSVSRVAMCLGTFFYLFHASCIGKYAINIPLVKRFHVSYFTDDKSRKCNTHCFTLGHT